MTHSETQSVELTPCPQCGEDTPEDGFDQGVCCWCCENNQLALDEHNSRYDRWQRLTDDQRDAEIKRAIS